MWQLIVVILVLVLVVLYKYEGFGQNRRALSWKDDDPIITTTNVKWTPSI